ncbi:putative protein [alpha proteobacterium Q-1]|nr:flagellar motor protein MotB [Iodidimonas nitroreducens]GAK32869.1 putative protein [alpha proteobacterium Q-1]
MISPPPILVRKSQTSASWMVSLADLLALMLTFFVLLFSMNAVQLSEWESVLASFRKQFNPNQAQIVESDKPDADQLRRYVPWGVGLDYLAALLTHQWSGSQKGGDAQPMAHITRSDDRVLISLSSDLSFELGSTRLNSAAQGALSDLAQQLRRIDNRIVISGHTDPSPMRGQIYASNWELSLRRAQSVADFLTDKGYHYPMTIYGYGAGQFDERSADGNRSEKMAQARRVEIEILAWQREPSDDG